MEQSTSEKGSLPVILTGHAVESSNIEIPYSFEGRSYTIVGKTVRIVSLHLQTVELLSADSTPHNHVAKPDAWEQFCQAVEKLISRKEDFTTVLRTLWAAPAIHWTVK